MAFTVEDLEDLIRVLKEHPEWRESLLRTLLTENLLHLPEQEEHHFRQVLMILQELAEAQKRTEDHLQALTARVDALAEQVQSLTARVDALAEREEHRFNQVLIILQELAEAQKRTEDHLQTLGAYVDDLRGWRLEDEYRQKAHAYFAPLARRLRLIPPDEREKLLEEAVDQGRLREEEAQEIRWVDILLRGYRNQEPVYIVVEVSWVIRIDDVRKARDRADLLARTGVSVIPVVAGRTLHPDAASAAQVLRVWSVIDGRLQPFTAE